MKRVDKVENEFIKAINIQPCNASLYNDYAVFLSKYRKDNFTALKYLNRAIKFAPENMIYKSNFNKLIKKCESENNLKYTIFLLFIVAIMMWIGFKGYTNFMNIFSLFILAQTVLQTRKNNTIQINELL